MGFQSHKSPNLRNFKTFNLGVSGQNDIWVQALWLNIKNTIKGKVVASPSPGHGESCESVFARGLSVHQKCFNYALTNLLFGLWRFVGIIDLLVSHPSHILGLQRAHLPSKCCKPKSVPQLIILPMFSPLDLQLSLSRN